ncbi:hypothetical protein MHU86_9054 [Fragilaria crotonensis]|nr:hypothetical protein MHU86_9054 [Fragilaria crotonensis]
MDDNHSKTQFMYGADNEYTPATPEHVVFPPGTVFTAVSRQTNSSSASTALLRLGTLPVSTHTASMRSYTAAECSSLGLRPAQPPAALAAFQSPVSRREHPVHGDAINGPGHNDGIGPMSERDPGIENAVNPNFNDDICENVLAVVNMSANTSIYSPPALSSRRSVHLYMPELTRTSCTLTLPSQTESEQNQWTEIFIKTPPRTRNRNSLRRISTPPYTDKTPADTTHASVDMLTSTFPAQPHAMSAFHRPDTKIYGETDTTNKKTTRVSHISQFFIQENCSPYKLQSFYFQPISEDPHIFHPIVDSATTRHHLPRATPHVSFKTLKL